MMQQINLYQPIARGPRQLLSARGMGQTLLIIVVALALFHGWGRWRTHQLQNRVAELQARQSEAHETVEKLETTLAARHPSAALSQALAGARHEHAAKRALLNALSAPNGANTTGFAPILAGLARTSVSGLWFTGIVVEEGGRDIRLTGMTTQSARVPELVRELADAPAFEGMEFKRLKISRNEGRADSRAPLRFLLSTTAVEEHD